jgi:hypothetical protein
LTDHLVFPSAAHVVVAIVLFFGGVAWLISIRPSHDFGGDAHVAKNRAGKLGKEADCFPAGAFTGWDLHPLESAATAHTPELPRVCRRHCGLSHAASFCSFIMA